MKLSKSLIFFCALLFPGYSYAEESLSEWYVGGFITQGFSISDNNNFAGSSSEGISSKLHELAAYATWRSTSQLHFSGQIMSRQLGEVDQGDPQLDYLLADYNLSSSHFYGYGFRVGRIKMPLGFYNETRDVSFTRASIILPQSLYFDQTRELQLSLDGAMFYGYFPISNMRFDIDFVVGKPRQDAHAEYAYLRSDLSGNFNESHGAMSRFILGDDSEKWKLGVTLGQFFLMYEPGPLRELGLEAGNMSLDVAIFGGQYNTESLSFSFEYMLVTVDRSKLGGVFEINGKNTIESHYLQAVYRFSRDWDLLIRHDVFYLDKNDRNGTQAEMLFGFPAHSLWSKDYTLGVGWQASPNMSFRAEWHNVQGTGWLPAQDNPDVNAIKKNWNLYLLQATYRF